MMEGLQITRRSRVLVADDTESVRSLFERLLGTDHEVVSAPDGRTRRSLAAYFYSNGTDDAETGTRYTTYFHGAAPKKSSAFVNGVKAITPPILMQAGVALGRRLRGG